MKPTTDIVEELRLYNRWRRGDEAITAPDPTALGKLLDDAADRIEHLFASGIHTCHADCQRPMCVLRRERDKAHADLARVTAELDEALYREQMLRSSERNLLEIEAFKDAQLVAAQNELSALRARVAELEAQIERDAWTLSPEMVQTRNDQLAAKLEQAEQRNAELVAALDYIAKWVEADGADEKYDREILRVCALARAESAAQEASK